MKRQKKTKDVETERKKEVGIEKAVELAVCVRFEAKLREQMAQRI